MIVKLGLIALGAIALAGLIAYLRPPDGDQQPLSDEALQNILRIQRLRGGHHL
jgi:hypothetical protein